MTDSLDYLDSLQDINVEQIVYYAELIAKICTYTCGWCHYSKNNRYEITNHEGETFLIAQEKTPFSIRCLCGGSRMFRIDIMDLGNNTVLSLYRVFRCGFLGVCCCCCCMHMMYIKYPNGKYLATVKQIWALGRPRYKVYEGNSRTEKVIFTVEGEACYFKCCVDIVFMIYEGDVDDEDCPMIGQLVLRRGGLIDWCTNVTRFKLQVIPGINLDVNKKLMLLGVAFLIDFVYYEH